MPLIERFAALEAAYRALQPMMSEIDGDVRVEEPIEPTESVSAPDDAEVTATIAARVLTILAARRAPMTAGDVVAALKADSPGIIYGSAVAELVRLKKQGILVDVGKPGRTLYALPSAAAATLWHELPPAGGSNEP